MSPDRIVSEARKQFYGGVRLSTAQVEAPLFHCSYLGSSDRVGRSMHCRPICRTGVEYNILAGKPAFGGLPCSSTPTTAAAQ